jgi:hypothetical protein
MANAVVAVVFVVEQIHINMIIQNKFILLLYFSGPSGSSIPALLSIENKFSTTQAGARGREGCCT